MGTYSSLFLPRCELPEHLFQRAYISICGLVSALIQIGSTVFEMNFVWVSTIWFGPSIYIPSFECPYDLEVLAGTNFGF